MVQQVTPEKTVVPNLEELSRKVAGEFMRLVHEIFREKNIFTISLAGGSTPRKLYELLANSYREEIPWSRVHIFFGDERCVPPDHPNSNFGMANESLFSKIQIPNQNINRIPAEMDSPEMAAEAYEDMLRKFPGMQEGDSQSYSFDLVLLGMGKDGHTASLFPGDSALEENERWVVAVSAPSHIEPRNRISLTLPLINRSRNVFFMVSGEGKHEVVQAIWNDPLVAIERYPAAMVRPRGRLRWFLDETAA